MGGAGTHACRHGVGMFACHMTTAQSTADQEVRMHAQDSHGGVPGAGRGSVAGVESSRVQSVWTYHALVVCRDVNVNVNKGRGVMGQDWVSWWDAGD